MLLRHVAFAFVLALGILSAPGADPRKDLPPADPNANKLTDDEVKEGWKLLFDGKALVGLRSLRSTDPLRSGWSIDRNALVLTKDLRTQGKITGGDLAATVAYDDFDFRFDFRLAASSDSGVLYFGRQSMGQRPAGHEYQIIDDTHNPDGLKGGEIRRTGSLYGILPRVEGTTVRMAERWNEEFWNHGRIVVQGQHVEHWLNGQKCLEYDLGPDLARKAMVNRIRVPLGFGTKVKSPVILLDQGEEIAFRNLKIRPLAPVPAAAQATPALGNALPTRAPIPGR
jgi:hypothetical protein